LGVTYVTRAILRQRLGRSLEDVTVAVQGFGNVGSWTARSMHDRGARIVAVSDIFGGIHNPNGLDLRLLTRHVAQTGSVTGFPQATPIDNAELLALDVDVLVPAAMEGQITRQNAGDVRATIVAEGANGPTTPEADEILDKKGIIVIPDILCNAGGVVVSYFEWVQSLQSFFWDENEVRRQMENKLTNNLEAVMRVSTQRNCSLRMAAYVIAVERIMEAIQLRGIYP
jgi:glutamate dehydrogenase (NAD(P)+)